MKRRPTDLYGPILDVWITQVFIVITIFIFINEYIIIYHFQIISVLLILHQVSCARDDIEGYRNRYQSYPRPSRPWPGDRQYGENYGWMNRRGENNWYRLESMWRWRQNNGWRQYPRGNNNYNDNYYYR